MSFIYRLLFVLIFQFDGLYGQDAYTYYDNSAAVIQAVQNFRLPPNFYWPVGYPLFTSLFSLFTAGNLGLAGLIVSLIAGALLPGVIFLLTRGILRFPPEYRSYSQNNTLTKQNYHIACFAGIITCFSGAPVKSSLVIMSDAAGLLFASLSMLFLVKYAADGIARHIILTFVFAALAIMTRYAYFMILIPVGIFCANHVLKEHIHNTYNRGETVKHLFFALLAGAVVFMPQLLFIAKYGIAYFPKDPEQQSWVMKWSPANFFLRDFVTVDGAMHYTLWNGLYYLSPICHPLSLSLFGFTFLYGLLTLIRGKNYRVLSFCLIWFLPIYLYLAGSPYQSLRYTLSYLPPFVIVAAIGLGAIKNKRIAVFILAAGSAVSIGFSVYHLKGFSDQKNNELEIVRLVDNIVPAGSKLFAFQITAAINHYSKIRAYEFFYFDGKSLEKEIEKSSGDVYFILPEHQLETQWKGLPVEKTFAFLLENFKPVTIASSGQYKFYKIRRS